MNVEKFFTLSSGECIPIKIETRKGMRNIILRPKIYPVREIVISKPWIVSYKAALCFLNTKKTWLEKFFNNVPIKTSIKSGDILRFLDRDVCVIHDETQKGNKYVDISKTILHIGGGVDMFERRLKNVIKQDLLQEVKKIIKTFPREYWPKKITLKDTISRWGSCSIDKNISLSWRLAFAPYDVMKYVVTHEVVHIQHMDHSEDFWKQVSLLYGKDISEHKLWLVKKGSSLYKYF